MPQSIRDAIACVEDAATKLSGLRRSLHMLEALDESKLPPQIRVEVSGHIREVRRTFGTFMALIDDLTSDINETYRNHEATR